MSDFAQAGIWLNFPYDELSPLLGVDPARMYDAIRAVGPEHFTLSSDAGEPLFPNLVSSPAGLGWTHPYAQTLRPTDPSESNLYQILADGREGIYAFGNDGAWHAALPGVLRGTVTKDAGTGRYLLTDLDGTVTAFSVATDAASSSVRSSSTG